MDAVGLAGPDPWSPDTSTSACTPTSPCSHRTARRCTSPTATQTPSSQVDLAGTSSTIRLAPYDGAPIGSNPTGLALDDTKGTLLVSNSGNNDVAVVDLASEQVAGVVPVGWYPTSVAFADGKLHVTNAKGLGAGPNNGPGHPNPESPTPVSPDQYSGSMMVGTLSSLDVPTGDRLRKATRQVESNNSSVAAQGEVIPRKPGQQSPIKHVIYVVKENRTYDQVLGSLGKGNGDPSLNLFGDESAPNTRDPVQALHHHRQLLRRRRGQRERLELGAIGELQPVRRADVAGQLLRPQGPVPQRERRPGTRLAGAGQHLRLAAPGQGRRQLSQLRILRPERRRQVQRLGPGARREDRPRLPGL